MLCQTCQSVFSAAEKCISIREGYVITDKAHHKSYEDLVQSAQQHCYICCDTLNALSEYYPSLCDFQLESPFLNASIWREADDDYCIMIKLETILWNKPPFDTRSEKQLSEIHLKRVSKEPAPIPISLGNSTDVDNCGPIIDHWLSKCTKNHSACSAVGQPVWYPTRLLDLGNYPEDHGSCIRIIHTDVHDLKRPYLTLSHCWGRTDIPKLTAEQSSPTIPIDELPKTFKDAISVAKFLGIPYLWIDSLCIRQDSKEDWEKEAAVMHKVYENAFCNIAATASRNSHGGLFYERDPILLKPCHFVYEKHVFQLISEGHWVYGLDYAPLNKRGWVVQERWFSPRIIHFSREQLFWECNEMVACESFPDGPPMRGNYPIYEHFKSGQRESAIQEWASLGMPVASPEHELSRIWSRLVRQYSNSTLTVKSDKLVAISGLASAIQGYTNDKYLAGLWRRDIIPQLAWGTLHGWSENFLDTLGTECYTAPSWPWASVSRPIDIEVPQDTKMEWGYREVATLIDYGVDLKGATITGAVCGGFLRLRGPLRRVSISSRHKSTRRTYQLAANGRTTWQQTVMLHVELDDHVTDLFFLCLYRTKSRNYHSLVQSDVSETDDHSKPTGDNTNDVGDDAEEVCGDSEYAGSDLRDEGHSSGDVGDKPGSTGVDWLNKAFVPWNTSNNTTIPDIGWDDTGGDDTVSIYAVGLLL